MANLKRDIRYINRDFNDFRNSLVEFSKTYFPNTYNDFSPSSTGMLFMEMAAYVGDVLSFYLDNQIQETFIQKARQTENLYNLAYMLGYRPKTTTVSSVNIDFYQQLPAKVSGSTTVPDFDYTLLIPENTSISSNINNNINFLIEDVIDFSSSSSLDPTEISVFQISGNSPTYYLLKKTRKAISATINTVEFTFNSGVRFDIRDINGSNIIGILDITDSEGNKWYEVPNLAQENVFDTIRNTNTNDPNFSSDNEVPYLLQLRKTQRRFTTRFLNPTTLQLQFGAGNFLDTDEEIIPNPDNVGLGLPFEKSKITTAFSPLNFMFTNTYGITPSNTTLTVRYLTGGGVESNIESGILTEIDTTNVRFINSNLSDSSLADIIFNSLASNNELAADGGQDGDTIEEIRQNALGNFQNQLRTVTREDYIIRALSMPSNLGAIAKAYAEPSKIGEYQSGELPTILDLYILSYDISKKLRIASPALKNNLKTYLSEYRMINDSITIKDAFIVNIGINFDIIALPNFNNNEIIIRCVEALTEYFNIDKWQINEPILLRDLYVLLDKIEGVQTVKNIEIINKSGEILGYSQYAYDVVGATINQVVYPSLDPMIFEVKYPENDIKGRIVSF
jgi:hypothetical protein